MSESRNQPRVSLPVPARIDLGDRVVPCELMNLSEGGLAVITDESDMPRGPVQISFRLGLHDAAVATIDAELVNHRRSGSSTVWGLRTLGTDLGTRTRLRDLVLTETRS